MNGAGLLLATTAASTVLAVVASGFVVARAARSLPADVAERAAALLRLHKLRVRIVSGMLFPPLLLCALGSYKEAGSLLAPTLLAACLAFEFLAAPAVFRLHATVRGERWSVRVASAQHRWQLAAQLAIPLCASLGVAAVAAISPLKDDHLWRLNLHLFGVLAGLLVTSFSFARLGRIEPLAEEHAAPLRAKFGAGTPSLHLIRTGGEGMWNAFAIGVLPKRRRILVSEDLVTLLLPDELHAILCHEMGHHRRRHLVLRVILLAVACLVPAGVAAAYGALSPNVSAAGPFLLLGVLGWLWRRQEREADAFAAQHASAAALGAGLAKLTNAKMLPVAERSGGTHPSLHERFMALGLPVAAAALPAAVAEPRRA